jgi:hypothetical protein
LDIDERDVRVSEDEVVGEKTEESLSSKRLLLAVKVIVVLTMWS